MKRALAIWVLAGGSLLAQVTVRSGKRYQMPAPGATSAVSLNAHIAEASVEKGVLTIRGGDMGETRVIAVSNLGLQEVRVRVIAGEPGWPPGFTPPQEKEDNAGNEEVRFSSDRRQVENVLDLISRAGAQTNQLHLASLTGLGEESGFLSVPSAYYRMANARGEVVFLDQAVNNSELTVQNATVRGLHVRDGSWQFHAGYTASADFADVFIPVEKEFAAGVGYTKRLTEKFRVTPAIYFLRSIDEEDGRQRSGLIGSLRFDVDASKTLRLQGEAAYGRSPAYAGSLLYTPKRTHLSARIVRKHPDFPTLRSGSLPGLIGEAAWYQQMTRKVALNFGASINQVAVTNIRQDSQEASVRVNVKLSGAWGVGSGVSYGGFSTAGAAAVETLSFPQQINFDRKRFGLAFQYQVSTQSNSFSNGSGFRPSGRLSLGRAEIGAYFDFQKDALTVSSLYSQVPALEQALQRLGWASVTPDQLTSLLQESAMLQSLGVLLSQAQVITVPERIQEGGNVAWVSRGRHPHRLNLSFLEDRNREPAGSTNDFTVTGSYGRQILTHNVLLVSGSLVRAAGDAERSQTAPVVAFSLRHSFSSGPGLLSAAKTTTITGNVFVDAGRRGVYQLGDIPMSHVPVTLDGERTVMTDNSGLFRFTRVSEGEHRVELRFESQRQHYFTTPADAVVAGGGSVDFGIAFPTIDLWGYVNDDAQDGLANIRLHFTGPSVDSFLSTDTSGKFIFPDIRPGSYQIEVDPESVAQGYDTENLTPTQFVVTAAATPHPAVRILPIRTLSGVVTSYDPGAGRYKPVAGAKISIPQMEKVTMTGPSGKFILKGLRPGDLKVQVEVGNSRFEHTISVPARPANLKDNFSVSSLTGEISSSLAASGN